MADNITIKDGGGSNVTLGSKDVAGVQFPQSTPVTPGGVTMVGTAGTASAGVMTIQGIASGTPVIVSDGGGPLSVDDAGGSLTIDGSVSISGTAAVAEAGTWVQVDDAAFTPATSKIAIVGAEFDDVAPDSVDEGDGGAIRMSANRNLYVRIRDDAGNERGLNINASGDAGVTARSGAFASGSIASGAIASGAIASGAIATGAVAAGAASIADNEDAGSADGDRGVKILFKRSDSPGNSSGTDLDYEQPQMSAGRLWVAAILPSGSVASGALASGSVASGAIASGAVASGAIASGAIAVGAIAAGATSIADNEDAVSADGDRGIKNLAVRKVTPANTSGSDGDYEFLQMSAGSLWTASVATDKTLVSERVISGGSQYETVAASQTAQVLGATGALGDYISGVLVIPATTSPGNVLLLDNATSITVFGGGASSVSNLVPFMIPLGLISVSGAWKLTTGANVSCIGIGRFT